MLLYCLPRSDPEQDTEFPKYAKHYIRDGLLFCRMMCEAGSFASLAEYRRVWQIGAIYNDSGKSCTEQDEDSEETGEDVTRDDSWNYTVPSGMEYRQRWSRRHLSRYPIKSNGIWKSGTPSA